MGLDKSACANQSQKLPDDEQTGTNPQVPVNAVTVQVKSAQTTCPVIRVHSTGRCNTI